MADDSKYVRMAKALPELMREVEKEQIAALNVADILRELDESDWREAPSSVIDRRGLRLAYRMPDYSAVVADAIRRFPDEPATALLALLMRELHGKAKPATLRDEIARQLSSHR